MIIIIDGYNLLKLIHGSDISETERSAFVNLMGRYIKKRHHKVIIVFDAGPCVLPLQEKSHGVQIIYSGEYQTADDIIMNFVRDNPSKEMVVITKDREIINHVMSFSKEVINPREFYEKVRQAFAPKEQKQFDKDGTLIKLAHDSNEYLDALMYEAAAMNIPDKDSEEYMVARHHEPKGQRVSKKQRSKLRIIDKL